LIDRFDAPSIGFRWDTDREIEVTEIADESVLVTGGSGYIAGWIVARLLDCGALVRATLRDASKADAIRANIATVAKDTRRLEFVTADLLNDCGWDGAMRDITSVMHVASPVMARKGIDTVAVAVEGTKRVLEAATSAGVGRVVLTSSTAAARPFISSSTPIDEHTWTDLSLSNGEYARSKTLAEQAAWKFVGSRHHAPRLATVLPGFVQGPLLGTSESASLEVVRRMLRGQMPAVSRLGFTIVDVRDLADLHIKALTSPQGMGERWIGGSDFLWLSDIAAILKDHFGQAASKVSTRSMPNFLF